jgi:UDP-N-acetyl-D-glucosamine dehydrogenase
MANIQEKIVNKSAVVGVVGLGYVGLPLAVVSAKKGLNVIGFDNSIERIDRVNAGINYISDILDDEVQGVVKSGKLIATADKSKLTDCDVILICVPTPLEEKKLPDMSYIRSAEEDIAKYIRTGMLIILESTTYPGTTEEEVKVSLEKGGLVCGRDFYLAFSAERVDPGNFEYKTQNIPKVVGGVTRTCSEIAESFYKVILDCKTYRTTSSKVAETTKLLENTYRYVNIALINQFAMLCNKMDIDIWEVIEAAKTKPFGFQTFYPGPGVGGHCIPLDPYYLSWKAEWYGFDFSMIKASERVNDQMPQYIVEKVNSLLTGKAICCAEILISGISYKANINDYRESPALKIIKLLEIKGAKLHFYDPYVAKFKIGKRIYETIDISDDLLKSMDLVLVTTGHSNVDYNQIQKYAKLIFDTRNALKEVRNRENIVLL